MSADALYSVRKFSFCKIYTVFVCNLVYRLSHKKIPYAVCWKVSKTSIRKRRKQTPEYENLSTLHKLRRTNVIEVNHWAKVANKTANIHVQNRSLYASLRRHDTSKTANIKKVILRSMTLPKCQCTAEHYHLFDICCF